ncbi:hypothetical protein N7523_010252 [Penicillium sp. IBT 18751x]|nr:hypothetical protein N7523_010252 [Penicillium sp. IBT 18751x]
MLIQSVDSATVGALQSRAPNVSRHDREFLRSKLNKGTLFPLIRDPIHRNDIWQRLKDISIPIPTLETFFQDIIYLDVARCNMRQICLSTPEGEDTVDVVLKRQLFNIFPSNINYKLWDLWRFSVQYAFEMTKQRGQHRRALRKDRDIERAHRLELIENRDDGFSSNIRLNFLSLARRHGFNVPDDDNQTQPVDLPPLVPCDFPQEADEDVDLERRCGKPFEDTVRADRYALSREALLSLDSASQVSAVFVRQSVFRAFFSYLNPQAEERPPVSSVEEVPLSNGDYLENWAFVSSGDIENLAHPSPIRPSGLDDAQLPIFSTVTPPLGSYVDQEPGTRQIEYVTHFQLGTEVGHAMRMNQLPHNRDALNEFFEYLDTNDFHIYYAGDPGRTIWWPDLYSLYLDNPRLSMSAIYCCRGECPYHRLKTNTDIDDARQRLEQAIADVQRAPATPIQVSGL